MAVEFDPKFLTLLEAERQRRASGHFTEQADRSGLLSVGKSGDGLGGRFASWATPQMSSAGNAEARRVKI